ncbi:MAG TPA: TetR/AcrR family transcriptional regulator [Acidiferrobacterales bacterium]|nr:TetR/AcrR family transcriptional regulator [Acidiferrobacterales bacterium]
MNAKSAKGEDTRLRIIQAAGDLFHKQGVAATSPDQVIEASGTGKGQFYHYFKSKEGLVHEVLQNYLDEIKTGNNPAYFEIKRWRDLERWFLIHLELQKRFKMTRSCPFGTIGNGVTEKDELIRQDLNLIFEVMKNNLAAFFIKEKAKARLSKDANENQLADFCIATVQGAMLMGKIMRNSQPVETSVREALAHLKRYAVAPKQSASGGYSQ